MPSLVRSSDEKSDSDDEEDLKEYMKQNTQKRKRVASPTARESRRFNQSSSDDEIADALHRVRCVKRAEGMGSNQTPTLQGLLSTKLSMRFSPNSMMETFILDIGSATHVIPHIVYFLFVHMGFIGEGKQIEGIPKVH